VGVVISNTAHVFLTIMGGGHLPFNPLDPLLIATRLFTRNKKDKLELLVSFVITEIKK
jgi:hypothetical protein